MNDHEEALSILKHAAIVAERHANMIVDECNDSRQAVVAACIILSTLGKASACTMHDLMGLLMETHRQTERFAARRTGK